MKNSVVPEKKSEKELFDETQMREPLKIMQTINPSTFSADVIILGLKTDHLNIME